MAKQSATQKRVTKEVMHEYKQGTLKSGKNGKGGKVKSRKQAVAIALSESGSSKYASKSKNKRNLSRTLAKKRSAKKSAR